MCQVGAALDVGHGSQELVVAEDQVSFQEAPPERRLKTGGSRPQQETNMKCGGELNQPNSSVFLILKISNNIYIYM